MSALDPRVADVLATAREIRGTARTVAWLQSTIARGEHPRVSVSVEYGPSEIERIQRGESIEDVLPKAPTFLGIPLIESTMVPEQMLAFHCAEAVALWNLETGKVTVIDTRVRQPQPRPFVLDLELWRRLPMLTKPHRIVPEGV